MTVPTIGAVSSGGAATSTWAGDVKDSYDFVKGKPAALYYNAAGLAIPNDTWTVITLDTEFYDVDPNGLVAWSIAGGTGKLVFNYDGIYALQGCILFPTNNTGERGIALRYNAAGSWTGGSAITAPLVRPAVSGWNTFMQVTARLHATAGSHVNLFGYQKSGGSLTTVPSAVVNSTSLSVDLISIS